ncbi:MAG: N-6 DNA methylase, partial [Candidatus Latescibacteria bacterium]|nr:N-6 DNA methylase [Candidatus Latescibacterota bacterium]
MVNHDLKLRIKDSLGSFCYGNLSDNALNFFKTLGYNTDRQAPLSEKSFNEFKASYIENNVKPFNEDNANAQDWSYVDLLFQLSKDEIVEQISIFNTGRVDNTIIESYLFFVIELKEKQYTRTALSQITREINKLFPMPAMILFKHGMSLSFSVINRRLHKRDERKDVLKKVTLIKDINIENPHRAHIEILKDLSFNELFQKYQFVNFKQLHEAWVKTLDTKELNKRFYKELSCWYFWAMNEVSFPDDVEKNDDIRNATNLIRLITRVIFIWFIKEKDLVPDTLFNKTELNSILKEFLKNQKSGSYYRAILQNLFFGTLNQKMDERGFAKDGNYYENRNEYGVKNLYRYADLFSINEKEALALFENIPFMNGGLFDCLDKPNDEDKILYVDGFSRNSKKQAFVPDYLFFSSEHDIDLNTVYGTKNKKYKVQGLIDILNSYKFTITENTPIEEEIALDPELLGKVFENLLASYNPETQTTARKQTGSFFTPREIVNYMVDESLKAYLKTHLLKSTFMREEDIEVALTFLLEYREEDHLFDDEQVKILIHAIDNCKILDPACGSGAFPMGILHKLVHILHTLDKKNEKWKERQINKALQIDDPAIRDNLIEDIESAFENNELDYGRKLYLIENCIYGVDIQPIAVQIAKLRFFISLVVDQKKHPGKENLGIMALPNLETKFVAANTLIGLDKPKQLTIKNPEIEKVEEELKQLRHQYFSAKTRKEKITRQKKDKALREKIEKLLVNDGWLTNTAHQIVDFNPYDQNASATFFDPEWMFGMKEGFDVVIGNPPYVQLQKDSGKLANIYKNCGYKTFERTGDIYSLFYEKGINILKKSGHLCFITSNKWMRTGYGKSLRRYFLEKNPVFLIDLGPGIFESATVDTNILIIQNDDNSNGLKGLTLSTEAKNKDFTEFVNKNAVSLQNMTEDAWFIGSDAEQKLKEKIERIGKPLKDWDVKINFGIKTGLNEAFIIDTPTKERLCAEDSKSAEILKPILRGRDIKRYRYHWAGLWIIASGFDIDVPKLYPAVYKHLLQFEAKARKRDDQGKNWWNLRACSYYPEFEKEKVVWKALSLEPSFCYIRTVMYHNDKANILTSNNNDLKYLCGYLNSKIFQFLLSKIGINMGKGYEYKIQFLNKISIPPITTENQPIAEKIEVLVDKILAITQADSNFQQGVATPCPEKQVFEHEEQIDRLV